MIIKKIFSSSIRVGFLTFISRIFGYIRDLLITYFFGANLQTDAFYVAFRIPNLFRRLLAEGTLSTTLVPFFTESSLLKDANIFKKLRNDIFTILFLVLFVTTLLFYFFSQQIIYIFAFGFDEKTNQLASELLRNMSPFLFLISLSALNMGLLNSIKKFNAPAFSPVMLNLGVIGTIIFSYYFLSVDIFILSYAVLFGAILQYLFQLPFIFSNNLVYRFSFNNIINDQTKSILIVIVPQIFGLAIYNLNILINTQFASFMEKGSVTYLYLAERLVEFPLGIFAVAVATTSLPDFAKLNINKKFDEFANLVCSKIKFLLFLSTPCAVAFIFLGEQICSALYLRGEFLSSDAISTSRALVAYSIGLVFVASIRVVTQAFYAIKDTRTPVMLAGANLIINILLCYILGFYFNLGFFGLALAASISAIILFFMLTKKLKNHFNEIKIYEIIQYLILIILLSFISIYGSFLLSNLFASYLNINPYIHLFLTIILSAVAYLCLAKVAKLKELKMIFE
jgi:putative peptidoglycan lipid II flippase